MFDRHDSLYNDLYQRSKVDFEKSKHCHNFVDFFWFYVMTPHLLVTTFLEELAHEAMIYVDKHSEPV